MAHLEAIASEVSLYPYSNGKRTGSRVKFPDTAAFSSMNKPSRFEGDITNLEVTGEIPRDINGTFYRVQPDHRFPPIFEDDIHFNGDGSVTAIRIKDGHADFKQRYVRTDKFLKEEEARQSLFGRYRNPYTDNESVKGVIRTVSNTNVTFWRGMLLASKEDGPPFAMDPVTLETIGRYDFEGQITAPTFTAHPKFDPDTGEMLCFAYEAGTDGSDCEADVVTWTINADGQKTEELWFKAPFAGMIHDCGVSKNYTVLPLTPLKMSLERLKAGGNKFAWDPNEDQVYGIVPRRGGKPEDVKWFRADNGFHGHVAGCYENEDGHIVFDLTVADGNVFFWFPPDGEKPDLPGRQRLSSPTCRWVFDPQAKSGTRVKASVEWTTNGEFSRIDDRYVTKKYEHFWQLRVDPARPYDFARCGPPAGGLFNCMAHYTWDAGSGDKPGKEDVYFAGPTATFQEPVFIPRDGGSEGEGYLAALKNNLDELRNDVVIWDALDLAKGPLATLHLPLRLRLGFHGNFVDHRDIEAWQERRRGELGPVLPAKEPLPWQKAFVANGDRGNGATNGHGSS
ncbi:Lignostilbene-alpha,beta-dioxygenase isozyme III [Daldinia childiae]|uniref:Lignostilbene-alpha,beta-dioxygenase isozyme III n=1 Tax=Daldinia childiae TaxID=326645 RepID=UPI00144588FE|nr:Lignostilbene-alpha,beta-dioxygenase isozyme III [Daldinia childiae]KAF3064914.1 Lignostilbene-alpha,beta-dioxygenase isozyme III [Daldinia childiae]